MSYDACRVKRLFFLIFQATLRECAKEDEKVNRAASLLSAFKTIMTVSYWCERKVVCLIFEATKEQQLDQCMVAKVCLFFLCKCRLYTSQIPFTNK